MSKYPIFEKCRNCTLDPFWQDIFEECSQGKFPQGLSYDEKTGMVTFSCLIRENGTKEREIKTCSNNPVKVLRMVKSGLKQQGISSTTEFPKSSNPIFRYENWTQIKSKIVKEELVCEYAKKVDPEKYRSLFEDFMSKINSKTISPEDIIMKEGKIEKINSGSETPSITINFPPYEYTKKQYTMTKAIREYVKERRQRDRN